MLQLLPLGSLRFTLPGLRRAVGLAGIARAGVHPCLESLCAPLIPHQPRARLGQAEVAPQGPAAVGPAGGCRGWPGHATPRPLPPWWHLQPWCRTSIPCQPACPLHPVMQGLCHEGTASSTLLLPITSPTSCSPALAPGEPPRGQAGAGRGGSSPHGTCQENSSWWQFPGRCGSPVCGCTSVCPPKGQWCGDVCRVAAWGVCAPVPRGAMCCQTFLLPAAVPTPGWRWRSVSPAGPGWAPSPVPAQKFTAPRFPGVSRAFCDAVKRCCPRSASNRAQPRRRPRCLPWAACAL